MTLVVKVANSVTCFAACSSAVLQQSPALKELYWSFVSKLRIGTKFGPYLVVEMLPKADNPCCGTTLLHCFQCNGLPRS